MVSTIKARLAGGGTKRGRRKGFDGLGGADMVGSLVAARKLADKVGGIEEAKQALAVLAQLE